MVYIAAQQPLDLIPWHSATPGFHVTELHKNAESARKQFDAPYVYYAGLHEGCGCGFQYWQYPQFETESRYLGQHSLNELSTYLAHNLKKQEKIFLYACWEEDEAATQAGQRRLSPDALSHPGFFFNEDELIEINATAAPPSVFSPLEEGISAFETGERWDAFNLLMPQADFGNPNAQYHLGLMYMEGDPVSQSDKDAFKWFLRAARHGHPMAQCKAGELYEYGAGVRQDLVQAYKWFTPCVEKQGTTDCKDIERLTREMSPAQIADARHLATSWKPAPVLSLVPDWNRTDAVIDLIFDPAHVGSPESPVSRDYFSCAIRMNDEYFDCCIFLEEKNIDFEKTYQAPVKFIRPDLAMPDLSSGTMFDILKGDKELARGKISKAKD